MRQVGRGIVWVLCAFVLCRAGTARAWAQAPRPTPDDWVVYATEVGWLRVGPRSDYAAPWKVREEINGGTSEQPLGKALLAQGFRTADEAITEVCDHLTRVQLRVAPPTAGGPARILTGIYRGKEYSLRLAPELDADAAAAGARTGAAYKALQYDFDTEWKFITRRGITPRHLFGRKQWLVHVTGRGSVDGPVREDRWMCVGSEPVTNERGERGVTVADGFGGTVGYSLREAEGPFLENYALAKVMKRLGVQTVDLWPPVTSAAGRDVQPRVTAAEIPDNPRDYGRRALPTQPVVTDPALLDWVIYAVDGRWLHVGTRREFRQPLPRSRVLWAGTGEEAAQKTLLAPPEGSREGYYSRPQALRALCEGLTDLAWAYHPQNQPRETIVARFRGQPFGLRLERGGDPDATVEYQGGAYQAGEILAALRQVDPALTPRREFRPNWLVHATGHGTISGPVKDDLWMMISSQPDAARRSFVIPDGMGGTFGYSYDRMAGPFTDNYRLVPVLQQISRMDPRVQRVGIWAEDRGVAADEFPPGITPTDRGRRTQPSAITLKRVLPESALPGQTLGITVLGRNLEPGCRMTLGTGIEVRDATYLGRDADTTLDQWVATAVLARDAKAGKRPLSVFNPGQGQGDLPDAFTVGEAPPSLCPPLDLIVPAAAREWISAATGDDAVTAAMPEAQRAPYIQRLQQRRGDFFGALAEMTTARDHRDNLVQDLMRVARELETLDATASRATYRGKLLERVAIARAIRSEETTFSRGMLSLADAYSEPETARFLVRARERALCLSRAAREALDEVRKWNYVTSWEDWRLRRYGYEVQRDDLFHGLRLWQNFNALRQGKLLHLLDEARRAQVARTGEVRDAAALRPYQRGLRDVHLDMGLCGLLYAQAVLEEGLLGQESYLASFRAADRSAQGIEEARDLGRRAEQAVVFGLKYAVALGGDGFGALADSAKRIFNAGIGELTGGQFETVSSRVTQGLSTARDRLELSLKGLDRLRGYSDEQSAALKSRETDGDAALSALARDWNFFLQTAGGLRRLAACYDLTPLDQQESEFAIALERARRSAADMRAAFNAVRGAESDDSYTNWRKALLNPFSVVKVLLQGTALGGDQFTATEKYIQDRESEATELDALLPALRRAQWEPTRLREFAPRFHAQYLALRETNPHALEWDLTRDHLVTEARLDRLERLIFLAADNQEWDRVAELQEFRQRNLYHLNATRPGDLARCLQLQGCDRLMVWDYDGALESFYQATEISEKVQPRARVEALREELLVRKTKEARLDVIFSLADSIFIQRMFQGLGEATFHGLHRAGLLRRGPRATAPVPEAPKGFLSRPIPYAGWADIVWGAVNPFKDAFAAAAVERELGALGKATAGLGSAVTQELATQVTKTAAMDWLGVRQEYADFFANALVNVGTAQVAGSDALLVELGRGLRESISRYAAGEVNVVAWGERRQARRSLSGFWRYLDQLRDWRAVTEGLHGRSLVGKADAEIRAATAPAAAADTRLRASLEPLTAGAAKERLQAIAGAAHPDARRELVAAFFRDYPITAEGGPVRDLIKGLKKERNPDAEPLNDQMDQLRWELLTSSMQDFLQANPRFRAMFVDYVFIGAAANKQGKAYRDKKCLTDVDFTALLQENVSNSDRKAFETSFEAWFEQRHRLSLAHLDVSVMGDFRPEFRPELESVNRLVFERDPARLEPLRQFLERDAEKIRTDAFHGERYHEMGNILFLNLGLKIVGNLKRAERQGNDLANEPPEKVADFFKGIALEPWMAFDVAIGQLGFLFRHREPLRDPGSGEPVLDADGKLTLQDPVAYHKYLCKYPGSRGLFGNLLLSARARERLTSLTRQDAEANGWESMEEVVNHVAREMIQQHGLQELGLVPPPGLDAAAAKEHYLATFDMWLLAKSGAPPEVVAARQFARDLGRPARATDLQPLADPAQVSSILAEHARRTEGFTRTLISRSLLTQATEMKKLENAAQTARKENTPEGLLRAQVLEAQLKRVFFRLAATWFRMKREVQAPVLREALELVLREAPSEADFVFAIAAVENMGPRVRQPDGTLDPTVLATWQPQVFTRDNEALNALADQLRTTARAANTPRFFDSRLRAAWD